MIKIMILNNMIIGYDHDMIMMYDVWYIRYMQ